MLTDPWLYLVLCTQFSLTILGAVVSVHEEWAKGRRIWVLGGFIVLGLLGLSGTVVQSVNSVKESAEHRKSIEALGRSLSESTRLQQLNTELQKRLLSITETVAALSKQSIDEVTGGESICFIHIDPYAGIGYLETKGKYPVSQIQIRLVDLEIARDLLRSGEDLSKADTNTSLPYIKPGSLVKLFSVRLDPALQEKQYNIFILARNGAFDQILRLRRVNNQWLAATRVTASYYNGRRGLVHEQINTGFPRERLASDPDWTATGR